MDAYKKIMGLFFPLGHLSLLPAIFIGVVLCFSSCLQNKGEKTILIENVMIVDGMGNPPVLGSIRIKGNIIHDVGSIQRMPTDSIIDGNKHFLAPGFIDTHSHHDYGRAPTYEAALSQGITTIIIGQDGSSKYPLQPFLDTLEAYPPPVNVGTYVGHNTLREKVMGLDDYKRNATEEEVDSMIVLLQGEMQSGAIGMSTGLEYDPGIYSSKEEVITLAKELKAFKGRYISHMRSEDVALEEAIEEIINIGKLTEIPVQISHFKLGRKGLWGQAARILDKLDSARTVGIEITADVYPYEYWSSTMTVLFPKRDFDNIASARFALTELTSPEGMIISRFEADTSYVGKTLETIAKERNQDPAQAYLDLLAMSRKVPGESIIAKSMSDEDIFTLLAWPYANVCSDGAPKGHPRGWGAFPRYFQKASQLSVEDRIQKMTSSGAKNLGLKNIGVIKPGAYADLVLFNPEELKDRATFENSTVSASGIYKVWVSGIIVFDEGKLTGVRSGRVIRRGMD